MLSTSSTSAALSSRFRASASRREAGRTSNAFSRTRRTLFCPSGPRKVSARKVVWTL